MLVKRTLTPYRCHARRRHGFQKCAVLEKKCKKVRRFLDKAIPFRRTRKKSLYFEEKPLLGERDVHEVVSELHHRPRRVNDHGAAVTVPCFLYLYHFTHAQEPRKKKQHCRHLERVLCHYGGRRRILVHHVLVRSSFANSNYDEFIVLVPNTNIDCEIRNVREIFICLCVDARSSFF